MHRRGGAQTGDNAPHPVQSISLAQVGRGARQQSVFAASNPSCRTSGIRQRSFSLVVVTLQTRTVPSDFVFKSVIAFPIRLRCKSTSSSDSAQRLVSHVPVHKPDLTLKERV